MKTVNAPLASRPRGQRGLRAHLGLDFSRKRSRSNNFAPGPNTAKLAIYRRNAAPTAFGEGTEHPKILWVGAQLGNQANLQGRPFVETAGELLDSALLEAGIDREETYITRWRQAFQMEFRDETISEEFIADLRSRPFGYPRRIAER